MVLSPRKQKLLACAHVREALDLDGLDELEDMIDKGDERLKSRMFFLSIHDLEDTFFHIRLQKPEWQPDENVTNDFTPSINISIEVPVIVKSIAEDIYMNRTWNLLPILADSIEDSCKLTVFDRPLLHHFRKNKYHNRGCWALDLVLGLK